jgi:predicted NBD/HSP70 family sugar kinase
MLEEFELVKPGIVPPLDNRFRPAALANKAFQAKLAGLGVPLVIGLERENAQFSRFETQVFPEGHPLAGANFGYVERLVKFLLWQRGGYRIYIGGPESLGKSIQQIYSPTGKRKFDYHFMTEQVYEEPFSMVSCDPSEVPPTNETGRLVGRYLDGCRVGFDLGASDRKVSAVIDGNVVFSDEVIWEPGKNPDPDYHYREIMSSLKSAAAKMPHLDAIGGSSAGIYIDNRPMVASLFRGVPPERFHEVRDLFRRIGAELNVPLEVINDGDVTALAGSMSLEDNGVLGIAMGSSEAAGYVDLDGHITGWLNELAFAPVDFSPQAPADEWSGDSGCGAMYFSQQCVFRLAPAAGIEIPPDLADAEKLKFVQEKLEGGHEGAVKIWQTIGVYLGYSLAHYADFYDIKHVLILGRCTSGLGGELILSEAKRVLGSEFPELSARFQIQLPDERSRRVGQSIAAASLPNIRRKG